MLNGMGRGLRREATRLRLDNPMATNDTYDQGYDAHRDGVDASDNPTTQPRNVAARKHDYDESEG